MENFRKKFEQFIKNFKPRMKTLVKDQRFWFGSISIVVLVVVLSRFTAMNATPSAQQAAPTAGQTAEVQPTHTSPVPTNTNPAPTDTTAPTAETKPTSTTAAPAASTLVGDMIRGGKLYDNWWTETDQDAPTENQPLWKTQTTNTRKGSSTWRCAECHGWDYKGVNGSYATGSHKTGFVGVLQDKGKSPEEILAALKGKTNPDHDFSTVLEEQDLIDLALFISQGTMDVSTVLNDDGSPKGNAADGKQKFDDVCSACHGPNGTAIDFAAGSKIEYLADPGNSNPFQFVHRMRVGVAVWPMPSAIENKFTDQDLANVLAYVRTLPHEANASGGGQLYDKWYTVLGVNTPTENNPLWAKQTTNTRKGTSTWSCRECHGVDYLGAAGEYASGSHKTGFPGVMAAQAKSEQEITDILTGKVDPDHDYSKLLDEASIKALVHFFQKEMVDFSSLITADGKVKGDLEHGKTLFNATCAKCHGEDGKAINFHAGQDTPEYVGTVAAGEASVLLHRVMFGVPGFPMSAGIDMGFSMTDIADVSAYAQTLPTK